MNIIRFLLLLALAFQLPTSGVAGDKVKDPVFIGTADTSNFSSKTGSGNFVLANGATMTSGVFTGTYNGLTITSTSGGVITVANSKTLAVSNSLTLAGNDGATLNIGNGVALSSIATNASATLTASNVIISFASLGTTLLNASQLLTGTVPDARLSGAVMAATADGDSRTDPGNTFNWFDTLFSKGSYIGNLRRHNGGVSGKTMAQIRAGLSSSGTPSFSVSAEHQFSPAITGLRSVFALWAGTNDFPSGTTGSAVFTDYQFIQAAARTDGYSLLAGFTETPRSDVGWTGGMETQRLAYNTSLRGQTLGVSGAPDILIDTDAMFPDPNSADYSDHLHLTPAAQARLAAYVKERIEGSLYSYGKDIRNPTILGGTTTNTNFAGGYGWHQQVLVRQIPGGYDSYEAGNQVDNAFRIKVSEVGAGDNVALLYTNTNSALAFGVNGAEVGRFLTGGQLQLNSAVRPRQVDVTQIPGGFFSLQAANGTDSTFKLQVSEVGAGDKNTTLSTPTNTDIVFSPNNVEGMRLNASGQLIIASAVRPRQISVVQIPGGFVSGEFGNGVDANVQIQVSEIGAGDKRAIFGTNDAADVTVKVNSAEKFRFAQNGNFTAVSSYMTGTSTGYAGANGVDVGYFMAPAAPSTSNTFNIGSSTNSPVTFQVNNTEVSRIDSARASFSKPAKLMGYTVSTLPTGSQGDTAFVTDALAPTFLVGVVGGGAVATPVFFNGSAWVSY